MKLMLLLESPGFLGIKHNFDKPFMQSLQMFFGMSFAFLFVKCQVRAFQNRKHVKVTAKDIVFLAIPTFFDLFASTLMTFGLIYVNVSVFQMLRGSITLFTAMLSYIFLKRKLKLYEWFAVLITTIALLLIGYAGIKMPDASDNTKHTAWEKVIGSIMILVSQIVQAGQVVVEEFLLKDLDLPPLYVVGFEGVLGMVEMIFIAIPLAYIIPGKDASPLGTSLENIFDSFIQLWNSRAIIIVSLMFIFSVLFFNIFGMVITSFSSAVYRTILEPIRTLGIWIIMLLLHAFGSEFGEVWSKWSFLELFGFLLSIFATLTYNKAIKLPFFRY